MFNRIKYVKGNFIFFLFFSVFMSGENKKNFHFFILFKLLSDYEIQWIIELNNTII